MQNRYVGDIGDFAKYGLLRRLSAGMRLGVAWYLFPDEAHNGDGGHVAYLDDPGRWRGHDPDLFDALGRLVHGGHRNVAAIEASGVLGGALFSSRPLDRNEPPGLREAWRRSWFEAVRRDVADAEIVFADPDNGLCFDGAFRPARRKHWKRLPLTEAVELGRGRCAVIYHHNTRRPGGHAEEVRYWLGHLPDRSLAVRARASSSRTFFIINATPEVVERARGFAREWPNMELYEK